MKIGGSVSGTGGTFTASTGTVEWNGGAQTIAGVTYNNLTLSGSGAKTMTGVATINGDFTLSGTATATAASGMTIGGSVSIGAGTTFNAGTYTHYVGGNWSNGGTFTASTSTITFNGSGSQTINNANTWYGLAITAATARTVSFQSGVTQTVSNTLTFTGASGQLLTLAPLTGGSAWNLTFSGATQSVSYVSVSYSNAGGGTAINATNGTNNDGGNNTNWSFLNTYTSTGTGNWNTAGTWTPSGPPTAYSNVTINATHTVTVDVAPPTLNNLTVNGTLDVGTYTITGSTGSTLTVGSGGTLLVGGSFPSGFTTYTLNGTVNYNGGVQTVSGQTYNNLTLSGSGAKTTTSVTVTGILSMEGTATAIRCTDIRRSSYTTIQHGNCKNCWCRMDNPVCGHGWSYYCQYRNYNIECCQNFNASVPLTINSGAILAMSTYLLTLNGDLINNGGTTTGSGGVTIAGTVTQSIGVSQTQAPYQ